MKEWCQTNAKHSTHAERDGRSTLQKKKGLLSVTHIGLETSTAARCVTAHNVIRVVAEVQMWTKMCMRAGPCRGL